MKKFYHPGRAADAVSRRDGCQGWYGGWLISKPWESWMVDVRPNELQAQRKGLDQALRDKEK